MDDVTDKVVPVQPNLSNLHSNDRVLGMDIIDVVHTNYDPLAMPPVSGCSQR